MGVVYTAVAEPVAEHIAAVLPVVGCIVAVELAVLLVAVHTVAVELVALPVVGRIVAVELVALPVAVHTAAVLSVVLLVAVHTAAAALLVVAHIEVLQVRQQPLGEQPVGEGIVQECRNFGRTSLHYRILRHNYYKTYFHIPFIKPMNRLGV